MNGYLEYWDETPVYYTVKSKELLWGGVFLERCLPAGSDTGGA